MRKVILTVVVALSTIMVHAQKSHETKFQQLDNGRCRVAFTLNRWSVKEVNLGGSTYQQIEFSSSLATDRKGWAALPYVSANIQIDDQKPVSYRVVGSSYKDVQLQHPLVPSRGTIYRNQNPNDIPYIIDPKSMVNTLYPGQECNMGDPYIFRDVRGVTLHFYPFQYNAAKQTLRVYTSLEVEVVEQDGVGENPLVRNPLAKLNIQQQGMYRSMFLNYNPSKVPLPITAEYGDILVFTTARDEAAIEPYIQWKKEKGFNITKMVVATGTNITSAVKTAYQGNPNLMFVQLVGDWADVKCDVGGGASAPMDPMVGCVVGTDNFPDIAVGRFSCNNSEQLTVQVNKTIQYEKNPDNAAWYESAINIASNEGGGGNGDDGESDTQHSQIIWTNKLDPDTYNVNYTHYQGQSNCTAAGLATSLNTGASIINYTGHGSHESFSTTGFNNTNVSQLTNATRLPFIFSVACVNGEYHTGGDCFAEAWMRKSGGGAIAAVMSTINQPWNPPMAGQDYFNDILTGGYNYTTGPGNGTNTEERRTLLGNVHVNGQNLMLQENSTGEWLNTAQTWVLFGDASLQIRTAQPKALEVSSTVMLFGIPFNPTITTNGTPVAHAQVCLSQGITYLSAFTDANGQVSIPTTSLVPGEVKLVVTAFNTTTIYQTVNCIPANGPYLLPVGYKLNGDGLLSYGDTALLTLSMKNVGEDPTSGVTTVTLSSVNPLLTVTGTATFNDFAPDTVLTAANAFTVSVSRDVENGMIFPVTVTASDNDTTWTGNISIKVFKPILKYQKMSWSGSFEPGDTVQVVVECANIGGYRATNVVGTLTSTCEYATIINPIQTIDTIVAGGNGSIAYAVAISSSIDPTTIIPFHINFKSDEILVDDADLQIANMCKVFFDLYDGFGDGWTGNKLVVSFSDGSPTVEYTLNDGSEGQFFKDISVGTFVTVKFVTGSYSSETSFKITYEDGRIITEKSAPTAGIVVMFVCDCNSVATSCAPPTNLTGEPSYNANTGKYKIDLSWQPSADAKRYNLYRDGQLFISALNPMVLNFSDTTVGPAITYKYKVTAIYGLGESPSSNELTVSTASVTPCVAPTDVAISYKYVASADEHQVKVTWKATPGAQSYVLYRNNEILAQNITALLYIDKTAAQGSSHSYKVKAICLSGDSPMSSEVSVVVLPCVAPQNLQATQSYSSVHQRQEVALTWQASESVTKYKIFRNGNVVAKDYTSTSYIDTTVKFATEYKYKVKAMCNAGDSQDSNEIVIATWSSSLSNLNLTETTLYPNPANSELVVEAQGINSVQVYNVIGELVGSITTAECDKVTLDVSPYTPGIYIIKVATSSGRVGVGRVVVAR